MHTFFYGWRRKAGAVSLVMACAVLAMWLRSLVVADLVQIPLGDTTMQLVSDRQLFSWSIHRGARKLSWTTFDQRNFHIPSMEYGAGEATHYLALVVPPIVVSVWLILWKPQKRAQSHR